MGPRHSPRANIDQDRTSRGKDSRWAERDRMAPVWKCDRPLNVEPRTAMLIPARVSQGVTSVYLRIGFWPDLTNTDGPPSRNEKISRIVFAVKSRNSFCSVITSHFSLKRYIKFPAYSIYSAIIHLH